MSGRNLNFGCFDKVVDGWVNADVTPHVLVARVPGAARLLRTLRVMSGARFEQHRRGIFRAIEYLDLTRRFPYSDASFDNAFSAHVLEHLDPADARRCVAEVFRILKPGGVLRISVPDLDLAVRLYDPSDPTPFLQLMYTPEQTRAKNRHHWMYNEQSLGRLMRECGFATVQRRGYRDGRCPNLDHLDNRPDVSLFMEGVK